MNDPASQPVYVHCVGGRHRTGVMTAAYRMTHEGWSGDQAFKEMKQYNFGSDFLHPEFKQFVYGYHPDARVAATVAATAAASVQPRWMAPGGRDPLSRPASAVLRRKQGGQSLRKRSRMIRDCSRLTWSFCPLESRATCVPPGMTFTFVIRSMLASVPRPRRMKREDRAALRDP